jgi:hypothetical protein
LGIGDWGLGPIPNPQSPIPNEKQNIKSILDKKLEKEEIFNKAKNDFENICIEYDNIRIEKNSIIKNLEQQIKEIEVQKNELLNKSNKNSQFNFRTRNLDNNFKLYKKLKTTFLEKIKNQNIKFSNNNKTITKVYENHKKYIGTADADFQTILCSDKIPIGGICEVEFILNNIIPGKDFYIGIGEFTYDYRLIQEKSVVELSMVNMWISGDYDSKWSLNDEYYEFENGDIVSLCIHMDDGIVYLKNNGRLISKIVNFKANVDLYPYLTFAGQGFQISLT